jgi:pilus assembly protein Flp/PilA
VKKGDPMAPLQRAVMAFAARLRREEGQALVEYALILGLISVVSIAMLGLIGTDVSSLLSKVEGALQSAV